MFELFFYKSLLIAACILYLALTGSAAAVAAFPNATRAEDSEAVFKRLKNQVSETYFTNEELHSFIIGLTAACSDIMTAFVFGHAASGTKLLGIDISSSAGERCGSKIADSANTRKT
jgi:ABC-type transporter MlaC component